MSKNPVDPIRIARVHQVCRWIKDNIVLIEGNATFTTDEDLEDLEILLDDLAAIAFDAHSRGRQVQTLEDMFNR